MRDAFGGVFMIRLMLVFVFIFVAFTAISLNYAKAFRVKNSVIDFIEQQEITDLDSFFKSANSSKIAKLDAVLQSANYGKECTNVGANGKVLREPGLPPKYCHRGVIIEEVKTVKNTIIYNVYTFADWNLGELNLILTLGGENDNSKYVASSSWEITGEARVVKRH